MAEPLIDAQATLQCGHVGTVVIKTGNTRVQADRRFLVTMSDDFKVLPDCVFTLPVPPPNNKRPCTLIQWTGSARRVTICGKPALLQSSQGMSLGPPTQGKPLVLATQTRVRGT